MTVDYTSVGGRLLTPRAVYGGSTGPVWSFGWIPPEERSVDVQLACLESLAEQTPWILTGSMASADRVQLWEVWSDPRVLAATGGSVFSGFHQLTGSCVGAGAGNMGLTLAAVDVVKRREPESPIVPFWPYHYGRGRLAGGMRGEGEGSTGIAQAKGLKVDGMISSMEPRLPRFQDKDGLELSRAEEMKWSAGERIAQEYLTVGRSRLVQSYAQVRRHEDVREALNAGYPLCCASSWGGLDRCEIVGSPPILLNRRSGEWLHQQSILGFWDHPSLGLVYWIQNQWGKKHHGICPTGAPPGGYWVKASEVDWMARSGEVIVYSQYQGYPAPDPDPDVNPWILKSPSKYTRPPLRVRRFV